VTYFAENFNETDMTRILVLITLSDNGIETIKSNPDLPKKEMEFVNQWKEEEILESFFISVSKKDAVLIFKNIDEFKTKELIEILPYFPYMERIDYHYLNKQF
jgi:uncharacterized protein with GYD domain